MYTAKIRNFDNSIVTHEDTSYTSLMRKADKLICSGEVVNAIVFNCHHAVMAIWHNAALGWWTGW